MAVSITDQLRAAPPGLHGDGNYFGLAWGALAWLEGHVREGIRQTVDWLRGVVEQPAS